MSPYLLIAADPPFDTLQLGVADLSKLVLWHGNDSVALGDELAAIMDKEAVVPGECLQDLKRLKKTQIRTNKNSGKT